MSDFTLNSVNWQDGMLITQQHLKDQVKYLEELISWHAVDIHHGWGLVAKNFGGKSPLGMNLSLDGKRLRVEITRCQAIAPCGQYIEINESSLIRPKAEAEIKSDRVPVFLGVDPQTKVPAGEPDPDEDLPRLPYLTNQYILTVGQAPNLSQNNFFQIAELSVGGNDVAQTSDYYPPCLQVGADDRLARQAADFKNRLENLLSLSSRAYMAMAVEGALANETTTLQAAYRELMHQYVYHLSTMLDEFSLALNMMHPLQLIIRMRRLFRVFTSLLNIQPGLKDYLNEKYFSKERKTDVGQFISLVDNCLLMDYNHRDLGRQIKVIDGILNEIRGLMGFLAQTRKEQLGTQAVATDTLTYRSRTYRVVEYNQPRVEQVRDLIYLFIDITKPRPVSDTVILMGKEIFGAVQWANMQVRLGLNEARGLGETDPIDIDINTFGNKVALHPQDMLQAQSVRQITLIFRGAENISKFQGLGRSDLIVYAV